MERRRPDGSIWAQGFIGRNRDNISDTDPLHGIIRHFDRTGKLMGSFLPEAKLDNRLREMMGHLAVSAERVGWISWVQNPKGGVSGGYVEISADGSVQEYPLPAMAVLKGFAITDSGVPVAGVVIERGRTESAERSAMMALNREQRVWSVLDVPGSPSLAGKTFLGGSGSTLAIWDLKSRLVSFFNAE